MSQPGESRFFFALEVIGLWIELAAKVGYGLVCRGVRILRGEKVKEWS